MSLRDQYHFRHNDDVALGHDAVDLLSFMDMAANTIKMALEKSSGTKRKMSYRKYLQRHVKNSGDSEKRTRPKTVSATKKITKLSQNQSLESLFDVTNFKKQDFLQTSKTHDDNFNFPVSPKPTLKSRKLPPSFFVEPALWQKHKGDFNSGSSNNINDTSNAVETSRGTNDIELSFLRRVASPLSSNSSLCDDGHCFSFLSPPRSPSLPTDTLESILGQADLQDILNPGKWGDFEIRDAVCGTPSTDFRAESPCEHQPNVVSPATISHNSCSGFESLGTSTPESCLDFASFGNSTPKSCSDLSRDSFLSPLSMSSSTSRCLRNNLSQDYITPPGQHFQNEVADFHTPVHQFNLHSNTESPAFNGIRHFSETNSFARASGGISNHHGNLKPLLFSPIVPLNSQCFHHEQSHESQYTLRYSQERPVHQHFLGEFATEPVMINNKTSFFEEHQNFGRFENIRSPLLLAHQQHSHSLVQQYSQHFDHHQH